MGIRKPCPLPNHDDAWIELPDEWLGAHADRYDRALERLGDRHGRTLTSFGVSLSLLDDWRLPGLEGNPDNWDFSKLELSIIVWVNETTLTAYNACFNIPKVSSSPSQDGQTEAAGT